MFFCNLSSVLHQCSAVAVLPQSVKSTRSMPFWAQKTPAMMYLTSGIGLKFCNGEGDGCFHAMDAFLVGDVCVAHLSSPVMMRSRNCSPLLLRCVRCMTESATQPGLWSSVRFLVILHAHFSVIQVVLDDAVCTAQQNFWLFVEVLQLNVFGVSGNCICTLYTWSSIEHMLGHLGCCLLLTYVLPFYHISTTFLCESLRFLPPVTIKLNHNLLVLNDVLQNHRWCVYSEAVWDTPNVPVAVVIVTPVSVGISHDDI